MARDVRLDPFLRKRTADPDAVVRSAPAETVEKAWSDEAREAAIEARLRNTGTGRNRNERQEHDALHNDIYYHAHQLEANGIKTPAGNLRHAADKFYQAGDTTMLQSTRDTARAHVRNTQSPPVHDKANLRGAAGRGNTGPADQGKPSFKSAETFSPVGKQAPPGPRVIEVDGDQDSIARDDDLVRPGRVTDAPALGKPLVVPDYDPEDYGETPLDPDREKC